MKGNGSKILKVGSLEVEIPKMVVQAYKLNKIPGWRHYLQTENGETRLGTIPVVGTGTAKFTDATGNKVIERRVGFTLANDGRTRIPVTMLQNVPATKWLDPASYVSVQRINEVAGL